MKGDEVKALQTSLKQLGYYTGDVSGLYNQQTQKAVAYFQKLNGLGSDGIAGRKTRAALADKNAKTEKDARRSLESKYKDLPGQTAKGQESAAAVVAYARKFLGCPYVSGAAGPRAFECSGLTYYVYQHFGVTLPRKAREQGYTNYGIKILDRKKLMPGDLVFFNSIRTDNDLCDHVGIYIGNGEMINSPAPGMRVKISNIMNARDFSWGRRVFK
jgi:cell wall-associated NlpC family hydrolase